jgi:hypothetical protein
VGDREVEMVDSGESVGPIAGVVARWHQFIRGELPGGLDGLLHEDVVFYSPIVFTPQRGRDVTKLYLQAAGSTLAGEAADGDGAAKGFRYVKEVLQANTAVLEFETSIDGTYVNGVDLITCDDDGRIVEFKVMVRPLKAINAVHAAMKAMLESMA